MRAQGPTQLDAGGAVQVGGEAERYLRVLQLASVLRGQAWSIRPLNPPGQRGFLTDSVHPWASRWRMDTATKTFSARLLRPGAKLTFNSAFPSGDERGPAWTGRGLTGELQAGAAARLWRFRVQLAPILFLAQNTKFALASNGGTGDTQFGDARFPGNIDAPQRFGDKPYGRLDPGNSTIALELPSIDLGVSTAAQTWGPAREYPLVLSGNSGGFAHGFVATRTPLNIGVGHIQLRVLAGRLEQSAYSPVKGDTTSRWASAGVLVFMPRGLDGLELGVARFVQGPTAKLLPSGRQARRLVSGGLSTIGVLNLAEENQLGSAFFRWSAPRASLEVYGEYYREDYSLDLRRLLQYPDDLRSYTLGVQRVFSQSAARLRTFRFELVNGELSSSNRGERGDLATRQLSTPLPPYLHGGVFQGHTNHGLLLGSPAAYGGAGWRTGVDQFDARGRTSLTVERALRMDWSPATPPAGGIVSPDVLFAVGLEAMRFAGTRDVTASLTAMLNLNRNLQRGNDTPNLRATLSVRGW